MDNLLRKIEVDDEIVLYKEEIYSPADRMWYVEQFERCKQEGKNWDVSNVTDMSWMFEGCCSLEDISSLKGWDASSVVGACRMFSDCTSLADISALSGWDVSRVIDMSCMFECCSSLTDISPLKEWDVSNAVDMACMFGSCESLTDISPLLEWNMLNVRDTTAMFDGTEVSGDVLDAFIPMACPREGAFIGYKKCCGGQIVQLEIPKDAKRSSAYMRKCRCSKAKVLNIWTRYGDEAECAVSCFDNNFVYQKGETVEVSDFDDNRLIECAAGIHFFMTREEAEAYIL